MVTIQLERPEDFRAIHDLVARTFAEAPHAAASVDGAPGEAALVGWLRESPAYDAQFAFTAYEQEVLVGYLMATWGDCAGTPMLNIGPIAVAPEKQGQGIGSALMRAMQDAAIREEQPAIVLLGEPEYYSRFGFIPAAQVGVLADPAWGDYFQLCPLGAKEYAGPRGEYRYPEPFNRLG